MIREQNRYFLVIFCRHFLYYILRYLQFDTIGCYLQEKYMHSSIFAVNMGTQKKRGSKNRVNRGYLVQSNLVIRNFLVMAKLFTNANLFTI